MSRYINADELIFIGLDNPDDDHLFEFVPREFIDNAPTADVVEVVRCKDCIHMGTDKCPSRLNDADFYCCQGERREDENRSNI